MSYLTKQVITNADGSTVETEPQEVAQDAGYITYDSDTATLTLGKNGDPSKVTIDNDSMDIVVDGATVQTVGKDGMSGKAVATWMDSDGVDHENELVTVFQTGLASALGLRRVGSVAGEWSMVEGYDNTASGRASHAEGVLTTASGDYSHAEGAHTTASGDFSHTEGYGAKASSSCSHAEGEASTASGYGSHAEGNMASASGTFSHAEGVSTSAKGNAQHVSGKYNIEDANKAEIIGNGIGSARSNARTLDWNGNEWIAGALDVGDAATTRTNLGLSPASITGSMTFYGYITGSSKSVQLYVPITAVGATAFWANGTMSYTIRGGSGATLTGTIAASSLEGLGFANGGAALAMRITLPSAFGGGNNVAVSGFFSGVTFTFAY